MQCRGIYQLRDEVDRELSLSNFQYASEYIRDCQQYGSPEEDFRERITGRYWEVSYFGVHFL